MNSGRQRSNENGQLGVLNGIEWIVVAALVAAALKATGDKEAPPDARVRTVRSRMTRLLRCGREVDHRMASSIESGST